VIRDHRPRLEQLIETLEQRETLKRNEIEACLG
jgi:hypothetical protein